MPENWKLPRGRKPTDPAKVAVVHRMLASGITETKLLAEVAQITLWNAWNIRRKHQAGATAPQAR